MSEFTLTQSLDTGHKPALLFAGPQTCFSELYLQLVRAEFHNNDVRNETDLHLAKDIIEDPGSGVALLVTSCCSSVEASLVLKLLGATPNSVAVAIAYEDPTDVRRLQQQPGCMKLNDFSFLPMNRKVDVAMSSLSLITAGEHHIPFDVMEILNTPLSAQPEPAEAPRIKALTPREEEVLAHAASGLPNKLIADRLSLSESTVKLHIHHVISKLGVHNRTEAALIFHEAQRGKSG